MSISSWENLILSRLKLLFVTGLIFLARKSLILVGLQTLSFTAINGSLVLFWVSPLFHFLYLRFFSVIFLVLVVFLIFFLRLQSLRLKSKPQPTVHPLIKEAISSLAFSGWMVGVLKYLNSRFALIIIKFEFNKFICSYPSLLSCWFGVLCIDIEPQLE